MGHSQQQLSWILAVTTRLILNPDGPGKLGGQALRSRNVTSGFRRIFPVVLSVHLPESMAIFPRCV